MRPYMCSCERCGKEVPATLAGYAKMVLRNSARIDGKARALCPECAESLRAWFLAGAGEAEGSDKPLVGSAIPADAISTPWGRTTWA